MAGTGGVNGTISEDAVRRLAAYHPGTGPVTTCYLDVDGRHLPTRLDVRRQFDRLVRRQRFHVPGGQVPASVREDLHRMASHVDGIDRHRARGLAMFANSADGFFAAYELPVPVTSHLVVAGRPYVGQLEDVVGEYGRFAVLLVDHERTRLFVYELGGLVEKLDERAAVPRTPEDDRGDRAKARVASQQAAQVHQHVRHAAALAFDAFSRHRFQYLAVGAPPDVSAELDAALHPYVRERLTDPVAIAVGAAPEQVKAAAADVQERAERRRQAAVVARVRDGRVNGRAAAGLAPTLGALHARRVECLLVSRGYAAEGWRCAACGCLAAIGRACPSCGGTMELVADVVEEAVQEALTQSCRVHTCVDADLDVLGRIGAVLRY